MKEFKKGRRPDPHGLHQTLSIDKFADVKSARVDKQRLAQKQRLVRIKRAKQYNKVKQKLIQEGKYLEQPNIPSTAEPEQDDAEQQHPAQPPRSDRAASGKHASSSKPSALTQRHGAPSKHDRQRAHPAEAEDAGEDSPQSPHAEAAAAQQPPGHRSKKQHKKNKSSLQILAEKREKEKEELRQKQEEARKAAQERQAARAAAERKRKKQTVKLFKKTKKGQPIMKYRLEKILDSLTKS